jgi:phosphate transport system substrate-binding protein
MRSIFLPIQYLCSLIAIGMMMAACAPSASGEAGGPTTGDAIVNKGSDTMVNLALAWAEAYQDANPEISISVTGGGSGTGIAALINGTVDIANASRQIKAEERSQAEANGISPVEFVVARDAIAVVINHNNPVDTLTIDQISDIYSGVINNWSQVGGEDRPIVRLSRETNSGTHVYFLEQVLRKGNSDDRTLFSMDTLLLPSSEGITAEVRQNPNAIGYDGLGYVTEEVKVVAIAPHDGGDFVLPSAATANSGEYPIARDLYMYTAGEPTEQIGAYLDWLYGEQAQGIVRELGFVPIAP